MKSISAQDTGIKTLGEPTLKSPLNLSTVEGDGIGNFTEKDARVRYRVEIYSGEISSDEEEIFFEKAGPREKIYFKPSEIRAAIVTCGGLCPGINNVIRSMFLELYYNYGVREILGIRYGYQGLNSAKGKPPDYLTPEYVGNIHREGGSVLGSSRGAEETDVMVNFLEQARINVLFCIGGDGTQRGAHRIAEGLESRDMKISVIGIPKTIDNDIPYVWKTFGFSTAVEKAREVLDAAHMEAKGAPNGIGLVKVMGRDAGFIAASATLASQEVNYTLIPEVPFELEGENGLLEHLKKRILTRGHAVIVVAEGAGQDLIEGAGRESDLSGNVKYKDIGVFLKNRITEYFKERTIPCNLKYFDPSYFIRSIPANGDDSIFCNTLGRHAVHAGMAGKTDMLIGFWHNVFVHVPLTLAISGRKCVHPESALWINVLGATGQPIEFTNKNI
ncbi:ATP-dependent 6-phosphofructokinase [candidate division KSB1 bacterium]